MLPLAETIQTRRRSLTWAMALIAIIAADFGALRPFFPLQISIFWTSYPWSVLRERDFLPPNFPNLGLAVMILVLEIGLFRMVSRRGGEQTFWLGFEIAGWACVITCSVFARTIWWQARSLFEAYLLGRQIGRPLDMGRFVLFTAGLHLSISLTVALFVGVAAIPTTRRPISLSWARRGWRNRAAGRSRYSG
jgi:hypothetical protein